nr:hypothetical protein GTC16762_30980 [Pigmentibacter ruber]
MESYKISKGKFTDYKSVELGWDSKNTCFFAKVYKDKNDVPVKIIGSESFNRFSNIFKFVSELSPYTKISVDLARLLLDQKFYNKRLAVVHDYDEKEDDSDFFSGDSYEDICDIESQKIKISSPIYILKTHAVCPNCRKPTSVSMLAIEEHIRSFDDEIYKFPCILTDITCLDPALEKIIQPLSKNFTDGSNTCENCEELIDDNYLTSEPEDAFHPIESYHAEEIEIIELPIYLTKNKNFYVEAEFFAGPVEMILEVGQRVDYPK